MEESAKPWQPFSPAEVGRLFSGAPFRWWIAGGYAIDRFVGRTVRDHGDIDIALLRKDRDAVRAWLETWDCWAADPPGTLRSWPSAEPLPATVSHVWCRESADAAWRFQLMLDDGDDINWQSRRCSAVTRRLDEIGFYDDGLPFLAPEIQLYYKAKAPRPKDETDWTAAVPLLSDAQRRWLRDAMISAYGEQNAWVLRVSASRN